MLRVMICDGNTNVQVSKKDWLLWVVSFLGTLFLGIELGIAIAVRTLKSSTLYNLNMYNMKSVDLHVFWTLYEVTVWKKNA